MSYDFSLWKWKEHTMSPILCDLLLSEDIPVPEVEVLPTNILRKEIESAFHAFKNPDVEPPFELDINEYCISVNAPYSSCHEILSWFHEFAQRYQLFLYNPQEVSVSDEEYEAAYQTYQEIRTSQMKALAREEHRLEHPQLTRQAQHGDAKACVTLGNAYYFGEGGEQDYQKAFAYYQQAAELGEPDGYFNLASCYRKGEGVEQNISKAIELYETILDADPFFVPYELGEIYQSGEGGIVDLQKAIACYTISHKAGNPEAKKRLRELGVIPSQYPGKERVH